MSDTAPSDCSDVTDQAVEASAVSDTDHLAPAGRAIRWVSCQSDEAAAAAGALAVLDELLDEPESDALLDVLLDEPESDELLDDDPDDFEPPDRLSVL